MVPSARQAIVFILLTFGVAAYVQAQNSGAKDQTASISGKVTLKNKGVAGIVVVVTETNDNGGQNARYRANTDQEGTYRISNIAAGNYTVFPLAPALVMEKGQSNRLLAITAGEIIRDVDFPMMQGGVITGRITNADGQPLVEESVSVMPADSQPEYNRNPFVPLQTDDRGIYRAFGLRPGKYTVSAGQPVRGLPGSTRQIYRQTFYPSATEVEKATVIEVTEGGETNDVDIVVAGAITTFTVSGRVTDSETGKPLSGISFAVHQTEGPRSMSTSGGVATNSDGEFKLRNVMPGRYTLYIAPQGDSDLRAEPLTFDVVDKDLTGLEMKTKKGASLSGMVVLEGAYEKSVIAKLSELHVYAWVENSLTNLGSRSTKVSVDGSFKLAGLSPGNAHIAFAYFEDRVDTRQFELLRVEHNGVLQSSGISIKDGEQVTGLRLVAKHVKLTGAIRGQVKVENGELPPLALIVLSVNLVDENPSGLPRPSLQSPAIDSRGRFVMERLAAGTYEVRASVFQVGRHFKYDSPKQLVTVTDNAVTEITVTIKIKP